MKTHINDLALLNESGERVHLSLIFAVNQSVIDLKEISLIPFLNRMLDSYRITADSIEFEVTESIQADDDPQIQNTLMVLMDMGFKQVIDDFVRAVPVEVIFTDIKLIISRLTKALFN